MIPVRWRPSSSMQFSSLFLKSFVTLANNLRSIERISWRMAFFKSFIYGVCEHKIRDFKYPQKEKKHTKKDRESEGGGGVTARLLRNASTTNTRRSTGQVSNATEVANTEEKNADHLVATPGKPAEYYPVKICQVPVGHSHTQRWSSPYNRPRRPRGGADV